MGTTLGPAEGVAFALVGAEITGAALMTIVDGPAVGQSSSYKRQGKHLLQNFRFGTFSPLGCSTC